MSVAPQLERVKRAVPTPLKHAIKAGRRALYYAPQSSRLPPRGYRLEDYKRWFPRTGDVFLRYLKNAELPSMRPEGGAGTVAVVIMPWVSTPAPWYAIMLGLGLATSGPRGHIHLGRHYLPGSSARGAEPLNRRCP